jgi:hypothetical protein
MPRTRRAGRRKHRRKGHGVLPGAVKKGIHDINKITSRVARGVDKYPLAALRKVGKVVLKPRQLPKLHIGGSYTEKHFRSLGGSMFSDTAGSFGAAKTTKKGGRHRKGRTHRRHRRHKRHGGSRKRRGGSRRRR